MVKGATSLLANAMEERGISPEEFMTAPAKELVSKLGISPNYHLDLAHREEVIFRAGQEVDFMTRHGIKGLYVCDDDYPWRLMDIDPAPVMLYQLGECELNCEHPMSVVGTRKITPYGADFCSKFVRDIAKVFPNVVVVSGLAFGADAIAHASALEAGVSTVGVLAHGLDMIYPAANRDLAKRILKSGGALMSEYPSGTTPYRCNFLERNRIVAGVSDATIVIESEIKGGAMSTANYAFHFNRDVFSLPGRAVDVMSAGCNYLIRRNKAQLITSASDFIESIDWQPAGLNSGMKMRSIFPELDEKSKMIYDALKRSDEPMAIDELHQQLQLPVSELMSLLSELEFDEIILKHPGNRYSPATLR